MNRRVLTVTSLALFNLGFVVLLLTVINPPYVADVTDFGRDLAGARAIEAGVVPYQQLGALESQVPTIDVPARARELWVAHTPLALGFARLGLLTAPETVESFAYWITVLSTGAVAGILASFTRGSALSRGYVAAAGALLMTTAVGLEVIWVQGAALVALALWAVLALLRAEKRTASLVLLGLVVAWRPWCAPIALYLPFSESRLRDVGAVGLTAVVATILVLPYVGGLEALNAWLTTALPANTAEYSTYIWNLSLLGDLWPWASAVSLAFIFSVFVIARRSGLADRPAVGAISVLAFSPLVWPHYLLGLLPTFLVSEDKPRRHGWILAGAFSVLAPSVVGRDPTVTNIGWVVALAILSVAVWRTRRTEALPAAERARESSKSSPAP